MLKIYNNLTRQKETFKPIVEGKVGMYVCGVTTYDYCHVGHGRTYLAFDVINRYLKFSGYKVTYVRNVTDIEDKIINRANERNTTFDSVVSEFVEHMHNDFDALGLLRPDQEPFATHSMQGIIDIISTLIEKDYAYLGNDGDVYYAVQKFKTYGQLSKQNLEDLRSGERVQVALDKQDPLDFVLWKTAKPGEPFWESPWGNGRPGWHIECSAMSKSCLGDTFDIHGGGSDLQFPHHENEIAQSEAANGCQFVNYWIHTGMVQVEKEKMSKSLGNFFTIRDVLNVFRAESVRFFLLSSHYRSQLNYSEENLLAADASLERLYLSLRGLGGCTDGEWVEEYKTRFKAAMDDDFNTPEAVAVLFDLVRELNRLKSEHDASSPLVINHAFTLTSLSEVLGLLQSDAEAFLQSSTASSEGISAEDIETLIEARKQARIDKDFQRADDIRKELLDAGVVLEDSRTGTSWRREC